MQLPNEVVTIMEDSMVVIREPKNFSFDFNEDFDKNLKYEIEFIIKRN